MNTKPEVGGIIAYIDRPEIKARILSVRKTPRRAHFKMVIEIVEGDNSEAFPVGERFETIDLLWDLPERMPN